VLEFHAFPYPCPAQLDELDGTSVELKRKCGYDLDAKWAFAFCTLVVVIASVVGVTGSPSLDATASPISITNCPIIAPSNPSEHRAK
jgi:hypothetical protein